MKNSKSEVPIIFKICYGIIRKHVLFPKCLPVHACLECTSPTLWLALLSRAHRDAMDIFT